MARAREHLKHPLLTSKTDTMMSHIYANLPRNAIDRHLEISLVITVENSPLLIAGDRLKTSVHVYGAQVSNH